MNADDRSVLESNEFDESGGHEDLALAVAAEVVFVANNLIAVLCFSDVLVKSNAGDLGVAVRDPGDAAFFDRARVKSGDVLCDKDALGEAAVGEL